MNIISAVEKRFSHYIFIRKAGLLITKIGMICRHDIITISDGSSQKKTIIITTGRHQEFWGSENLRRGIIL